MPPMITTTTSALGAAWLVVAVIGSPPALAGGKTGKVMIETEPPGAKVYFNVKEDGEVCTTPCTVDAPIGETPVIIEAENRRSLFEILVVPRKVPKLLKVSYKLELAIGAVVVTGAAGATIKIDDEPRGKAPGRIEGVLAGAHRLVIERDGKPLYDQFVEIEAGNEVTIDQTAVAVEPAHPAAAVDAVIAPRAGSPVPPTFTVAGVLDIGFRRFRYSGNMTPVTQRDDDERGQVMTGPTIEIWPTTLLGIRALPGLAIYGRFEFGVNSQAVTLHDNVSSPTSLSTAWRSLEVSLHHRWMVAQAGTIEVGAGYTQDRYQFHGPDDQVAIVPDASYDAVRIGGRAALRFGVFEPYLTAENRIVLSGGAMEDRYKFGTSVNGVHGTLGAMARFGHIEARVEGGLTLYSWTFKPDTGGAAIAKGGSDFIQNLTFAVGYAY
jgi:hypothetical protein